MTDKVIVSMQIHYFRKRTVPPLCLPTVRPRCPRCSTTSRLPWPLWTTSRTRTLLSTCQLSSFHVTKPELQEQGFPGESSGPVCPRSGQLRCSFQSAVRSVSFLFFLQNSPTLVHSMLLADSFDSSPLLPRKSTGGLAPRPPIEVPQMTTIHHSRGSRSKKRRSAGGPAAAPTFRRFNTEPAGPRFTESDFPPLGSC